MEAHNDIKLNEILEAIKGQKIAHTMDMNMVLDADERKRIIDKSTIKDKSDPANISIIIERIQLLEPYDSPLPLLYGDTIIFYNIFKFDRHGLDSKDRIFTNDPSIDLKYFQESPKSQPF